MSKESSYLFFVQIVVSINTLLFIIGVLQAKKGNIEIHKKINGIAGLTTLVGVVGLVVTILMGWDYSQITTPTRMLIHRCFAVPLLPLLIAVMYTGIKHKASLHKKLIPVMSFFWVGTLTTGWWFF